MEILSQYSDPGNIQVRLFKDRLEILSPGLLPKEVAIETIYSEEMRSIPRNRRLALIFHKAKLIEAWGTGFQRMKISCQKAGLPDPEFFYIRKAFVVRFYKNKFLQIESPIKKKKIEYRGSKKQGGYYAL